MNKQTQFHEKNRRFVVSKFVKLSDELIDYSYINWLFYCISGPPVSMTWLGHRRLTIANRNSAEVTVILLPTNYEQDFNMDNVKIAAACRKAFMSKGVEDLMLNTVCLKYLLSNLASLIQLQKVNEIPEDRSLLASPFMKSLVALSEVFSLDKVFETSEVLAHDSKTGKTTYVRLCRHHFKFV